MIKKYIICISFLSFALSSVEKLPNDVRWITNSLEYQMLCEQIYQNAWNNISKLIHNKKISWGSTTQQEWVIVMDLDETVLDNSKYQIKLFNENKSYNPKSWSSWVNLKEAELVPGAKSFIDKVRRHNIQLIFLSNRMHKNLNPTIENMKALNIYSEQDIFLLRQNREDKKHVRRSEIKSGTGRMAGKGAMKVIAYFGDAYHDFPNQNKNYTFGKNMFMFPNPMYGKW